MKRAESVPAEQHRINWEQKLSEEKGSQGIHTSFKLPLLKMYAKALRSYYTQKHATFEVVIHVAALHRACGEPQQL